MRSSMGSSPIIHLRSKVDVSKITQAQQGNILFCACALVIYVIKRTLLSLSYLWWGCNKLTYTINFFFLSCVIGFIILCVLWIVVREKMGSWTSLLPSTQNAVISSLSLHLWWKKKMWVARWVYSNTQLLIMFIRL